jgi:hypothetical protein
VRFPHNTNIISSRACSLSVLSSIILQLKEIKEN